MYHNTVFSDLVKPINRGDFGRLVRAHGSDRYSKSFKSWQHLMSMLYCHFSGASSLREAEVMYGSHVGGRYHLSLPSLKRSTLSQANNKRSPDLFRDVACGLLGQCRKLNEAGSLLRLLDSSPIVVKGRGNQWTKETCCARIEGLKLHLGFEPKEEAIDYVDITPAKVNDITAIASLTLEAGKVYVFDKGYCDYNWWKAIVDKGSVFVTRLKKNAAYRVVESHAITEADRDFILKDQTIELTNGRPRGGKTNTLVGVRLRKIEVAREGKAPLVIVSNDLVEAPAIVAGDYKTRWQIELLFKWLKRYLHVKTFLGETQNSIKIQLYTAIIAYCLLWLRRKTTQSPQQSLAHLCSIVQTTLLVRPETERCRKIKHEINQLTSPQLQMIL